MLGLLFILIGAVGSASFYVPFKKVKQWSWESYWIMQGVAAWLIFPWIFAWLTVPSGTLLDIIREAPSSAKWLTLMFGAFWGVGSLTYGLSIRYMGIALGQSLVLGLIAAFGTLIPAMVAGEGLLTTRAGILTIIGVSIALAGIAIVGYAGILKNRNLSEEERKAAVKDFSLKKGIPIAILSGIMSASFAYGFASGVPIEETAARFNTNSLYVSNPTLIFITLGGFLVNLVYCAWLNIKNGTYKDYIRVSGGVFLNNVGFTFLAGLLWFLQFHFYGMGKSLVPENMETYSWSILMALAIAVSNIWGLFLKEWKGVSRKTIAVLLAGILILILSTFIIKLS
ncbi:MAG: L-rhamnose/proton symporter RhaT [Bacteroidota bacterium]